MGAEMVCAWRINRAYGGGLVVVTSLSLTPDDRKFLAGIMHQVWRACQVYVTVAMERGSGAARPALDELAKWAVAQRRELGPGGGDAPTLSLPAQRAGRELLEDVETISRRVVEMVAALQTSSLLADQVEEETLGIIEGVLRWTSLMASQLGITRNLRAQTPWFER